MSNDQREDAARPTTSSDTIDLEGKTAIVTGGSRGLGRGVVEALAARRVQVVAVARDAARLDALAREVPGVRTIAADASDEIAAGKIQQDVRPDVIVLCAGVAPLLRPIHQHTWETFSQVFQVDTKMAFTWLRDALLLPMAPGGHVVVVSSGAALRGSPVSGGYAAAKRAQWFLADYAAQESARLGLGLRVHCLLPQLNPSTELGRAAIAAYAGRAGIEVATFEKRFAPPLTPAIMGRAVADLLAAPARFPDLTYQIGSAGLAPLG
jgi:NAD(P)-dependent dehydrogenase (short-subunit alcohol dehydrogenase family)